MTRRGPRGGFCLYRRPQAAIGDERFTSQGSQQPPGSPLSREEGEAPPPAPAPEGRRRSRRVRLRGSCRHRPSFLGRRELATSAPARPAPASSEVSEIGNNGARGSEGLGQLELTSGARPSDEGAERPSGPQRGRGPGGRTAPAAHLWICAGGRGRATFPRSAPEGREPSRVLERAWSQGKKLNTKHSSLNGGTCTVRGVTLNGPCNLSDPVCIMGITVFKFVVIM